MPQIGIWISEMQEAYICQEVEAGRSFEINYPPGTMLTFGDSCGINASGEIARIVFRMRGDDHDREEDFEKTDRGAVVAVGCYAGVVLPAVWAGFDEATGCTA